MSDLVDPTTGEVLREIPVCDMTNPADLASWYGNFGFFDHYRKVVLAAAKEIERAKAAGEKRTETKLEDDARCSALYFDFLGTHLRGRQMWEQNVRDSFQR